MRLASGDDSCVQGQRLCSNKWAQMMFLASYHQLLAFDAISASWLLDAQIRTLSYKCRGLYEQACSRVHVVSTEHG